MTSDLFLFLLSIRSAVSSFALFSSSLFGLRSQLGYDGDADDDDDCIVRDVCMNWTVEYLKSKARKSFRNKADWSISVLNIWCGNIHIAVSQFVEQIGRLR